MGFLYYADCSRTSRLLMQSPGVFLYPSQRILVWIFCYSLVTHLHLKSAKHIFSSCISCTLITNRTDLILQLHEGEFSASTGISVTEQFCVIMKHHFMTLTAYDSKTGLPADGPNGTTFIFPENVIRTVAEILKTSLQLTLM